MNEAKRLLAPVLVDRPAHRAPHRFRQRIRIAPPRPRQAFHRRYHRIEHDVVERLAGRILLGDADEINLGIVGELALFRSWRWRQRRSRQSPSAAAPPRRAIWSPPEWCRPCRCARPAARSMIPGSPGPSLTRSPLRQIRTFGTPAARASLACSDRCSASPWTGIRSCGRTHEIMSRSSSRRGWPETWTRSVRSVMTSIALR